MNRFAEDMLRSRYGRDGRNPYGSRGGYVVSSHGRRGGRRDRGMYEEGRGGSHGGRRMEYPEHDMNMRDYGYEQDYGYDDYGYEDDYDYDDYGYHDAPQHGEMRRGGGHRRGRDYGETQYGKMSHEDIKKWEHSFENADGTKGGKYKPEQIEQMSKSMGVNLEHMGGVEVFALAVNMMYADYGEVAKKFGVDRPEFYIAMAKAFMDDKDFHGKGEEKLWLYYKCIAEEED